MQSLGQKKSGKRGEFSWYCGSCWSHITDVLLLDDARDMATAHKKKNRDHSVFVSRRLKKGDKPWREEI